MRFTKNFMMRNCLQLTPLWAKNPETLSNGALCIYSLVWIAPKEGEVSAKSFFSALPSGIDVNS